MEYYIDENGNKFGSKYEQYEEDGIIKLKQVATPQEVYQEWLKNKTTPSIKEPTTQEQINAQLLEEIAQQKLVNAQLMQEIATLKGGTANV